MFLRIAKEKVKVAIPMLNGEPALVKIKKVTSITKKERVGEENVDVNYLNIDYFIVAESAYKEGMDSGYSVYGKPLQYSIQSDAKAYKTVAAKLLKTNLFLNDLELVDADVEVLGQVTWQENIAARPIRLTIPNKEVIENSNYNTLVGGLISGGTPFYSDDENYYVYLEEIFEEHRPLLEGDENVSLEEIV
jgi:hypothetical protein